MHGGHLFLQKLRASSTGAKSARMVLTELEAKGAVYTGSLCVSECVAPPKPSKVFLNGSCSLPNYTSPKPGVQAEGQLSGQPMS